MRPRAPWCGQKRDAGRGGVEDEAARWTGARSEGPCDLAEKLGLHPVGDGPKERCEEQGTLIRLEGWKEPVDWW